MANDELSAGKPTKVTQPAPRMPIGAVVIFGIVAVSFAFVHAVFSKPRIDGVTLGLLALAFLPWLIPFVKRFGIQGIGDFEFREFERKVEESVEKAVERFAISGAAGRDVKEMLNTALSGYYAYLKDLEFKIAEKPTVQFEPELRDFISYYDLEHKTIVIWAEAASDLDIVYRDFGHHVLLASVMTESGQLSKGQAALESGLADYFLCSYKDDPVVFRKAAAVLAKRRCGDGSLMRDLAAPGTLTEARKEASPNELGRIWGGAFWEIRSELGRGTTDRLLRTAWLSSRGNDTVFPRALVDAVRVDNGGEEQSKIIADILRLRGVEIGS